MPNPISQPMLILSSVSLMIALAVLLLGYVRNAGFMPRYWSLGFLLFAAGFGLWSLASKGTGVYLFLLGVLLHISAFTSLAAGAVCSTEHGFRKRNGVVLIVVVLALWGAAMSALTSRVQ